MIIPWDEYKKIEALLGLDLDKTAIEDLKQGQKDRKAGNMNNYLDLDSI